MATATNLPASPSLSRVHGDVPVHGGGPLVSRLLEGAAADDLLASARGLPRIALDARTAADAELIATGGLSPLTGFMGRDDYRASVHDRRLASGTLFPIPVTLTAPRSELAGVAEGKRAALVHEGEIVGVIDVSSVFEVDRDAEASEVYRTKDAAHPGVAWLFSHKDEVGVGGAITLARRTVPRAFPAHTRDPAEVRALIRERGWRTTVAFQTRNPIHRAHEYLLRCALETVDGLVVHPLVGETKSDDVPAAVRVRCYEAILDGYFPPSRTLLTVFPFAMRYAGPREALLHAIARQNYGFSHFIVGRDHAGVGNYYGTYDAQLAFDELSPGDLAITPVKFEHSFYCKGCGQVASPKTCPHEAGERLTLSGTRVREILASGEPLPAEYTRPEVSRILIEAYRAKESS